MNKYVKKIRNTLIMFLAVIIISIIACMFIGCGDSKTISTEQYKSIPVKNSDDVEITPTVSVSELRNNLKKEKEKEKEKEKSKKKQKTKEDKTNTETESIKTEVETVDTVENIEINESVEENVTDIVCSDGYTNVGDYSEDICMTYIGTYTITFYSPDEAGCIGAMDNVLTPYYSCAMPDSSYLGHTLYIEGFGYRYCEDISPDGICDLYVGGIDEIPSYGMTTGDVYIVN